jgi:hypothetical protein
MRSAIARLIPESKHPYARVTVRGSCDGIA